MADLLTTKELQEILNIDRTTIYRMAESGRVPAVKVGNQWRFPKQQIEAWLQRQAVATLPIGEPLADGNGEDWQLFPQECVQLIQDSFADALGVMILVTDLQGRTADGAEQSVWAVFLRRELAGRPPALSRPLAAPGQ